MSGLIGQIGSRSGVIGTTELDYEEGTFTPSLAGSVATFTNSGQEGNYRKIGRMCWVGIWVSNSSGATSSSGTIYFTGLPFTGASTATGDGSLITGYAAFTFAGSQFFDSDGANIFCRQYGSQTTVQISLVADDTIGNWATANLLDNSDSALGCSGWYPTAY